MSQQPSTGEPMVGEVRFRVPLPIVIPAVALVIIAAVAIGFAQVLLSLPKEGAVVIAIATAANVLGVCAFVALRGRVGMATYAELGAILLYPVIIGAAIAALNIGEGAGHHGEAAAHAEEGGGAGASEGGGLVVSSANVAFDTQEIAVPADEEVSIEFINEDSLEHNIAVYETADASADIFVGEIINGGESITYDIPAVKAGEYYFQCDVHPNMNGAYVAE